MSLSRPRLHGSWQHEYPESRRYSYSKSVNAQVQASSNRVRTLQPCGEMTQPVRRTLPDPDASRPKRQFAHQVATEKRWLRDYAHASQWADDIDNTAQACVKNLWIENGVWSSAWSDMPGMVWAHEISQDGPESSFDIRQNSRTQKPEASNARRQLTRRSRNRRYDPGRIGQGSLLGGLRLDSAPKAAGPRSDQPQPQTVRRSRRIQNRIDKVGAPKGLRRSERIRLRSGPQ